MKLKKYPKLINCKKIPMDGSDGRLDAAQSAYFKEQITQIDRELQKKVYPQNTAIQLFPRKSGINWAAKYVEWRMIDKVGTAAVIHSYATDLKTVSSYGTKFRSELFTVGNQIEFDWIDIQRGAAAPNRNLPRENAEFAREFIEDKINDICYNGEPGLNLQGVLTHPNISIVKAADNGSGSTKWEDKTPEQIRADIGTVNSFIRTSTNNMEKPDSVGIPSEQHAILNETFEGDNNWTLKMRVDKAYPHLKNWYEADELSGVELSDGTIGNVAIFYEFNVDKIYLVIPLPFKRMKEEVKSTLHIVPFLARVGGFVARRPKSVCILEGI